MDEQIKPVAWRSKDYSPLLEGQFAWAFTANDNDLRTDHEPLYDQQAIDTLRAEVERLRGRLSDMELSPAGRWLAKAERVEAEAATLRRMAGKDEERLHALEAEADALLKGLRVAVLALAHASESDAKYRSAYEAVSAAIDAAKQGAE